MENADTKSKSKGREKGKAKRPTRTLTLVNGERTLSQRGYAILKAGNEDLIEDLKKELTVAPKVVPGMPGAEEGARPFPVYRENSKKLYVPRFFGLSRFGAPTQNRLHEGQSAPRLVFHGTLRPEQEAPVAAFLAAARDPARGGGLLVLPCAYGKTSMCLHIATKLQRKMLVVCHKEFLMNQWRERIAQFVPTATVGLIKASTVDTEDKDIVIASLQSLAMKDYPDQDALFQQFGFVALDECHHLGAEVFSRALSKITAPYTLGLSATPDRKDGLRKVFEWFIGPPAFEVRKRADTQLRVLVRKFYTPDPDYSREHVIFNQKPNAARMINNICGYTPRNELILNTLREVMAEEPARKVIILSDRRAHLIALKDMIDACDPPLGETGFYVGGMKQAALDESATRQIILATGAIANEGLDIPALNTLIFASPVSSLEQPVGRIQRQKAHERVFTPLVIDIWDEFSIFMRQGYRRMAWYKKNGYELTGDYTGGSREELNEMGCSLEKLEPGAGATPSRKLSFRVEES